MAVGKVGIGLSKPYVAIYDPTDGSNSDGQLLARAVSVSVDIESSEDNNFRADDQNAESAAGKFTSGSITIEVDGLQAATEKLIMGLPTADSDGWYSYDDDQAIPYVSIGFIERHMSDGVESWTPVIFPKCKFKQVGVDLETLGEEIDWQTQELEATIFVGDDAKHQWRIFGTSTSTQAAAEAMIKTKFGIPTNG